MATPYDQIPDRRAIVRRRALEEALAALVEDMPAGSEPPRTAILALLREAMAAGEAGRLGLDGRFPLPEVE